MAVTPTPIFPQALLSAPTQFNNATSTSTPTQILAAKTNGAKIEGIYVTSTDTSSRDLQLFLNVSATNYPIGTISIPATAGTVNNVPTVSLFAAVVSSILQLPLVLDSNGNPYLYLDPSTSLTAEPLTTITSGKFINIFVCGGAF